MTKQEIPPSPFKFLDAYLKEDKDEFFGRKEEIDELYNLVSRHKFVVVYGKTGTGKTSLIRCGLANCFEETDWFALYLRRGNNLMEAITCSLRGSGVNIESQTIAAIQEGLISLVKDKLRPVYIIFDQFEELLILGSEKEKHDIFILIKSILANEKLAACNQIISIREEYFGSLELLVKDIPQVLDARLHLRSMDREQVMKVIEKSGPKYNITFEDNAIARMVDVLQDQSDISLPYLQVYMDQLWRRDFERTYPEGISNEMGLPYLHWEISEIEESGALKDVLQRFLYEQSQSISKALDDFLANRPEMKQAGRDSRDLLDEILDALVTNEGTKYPLEISSDINGIKLGESAPESLKRLDERLLNEVLSLLESHRILRKESRYVELAHDKISELIYQKRTQLIGQQNDLQVIIEQVHKDKKQVYLSDIDINRFDKISSRLDEKTRDFLNESKKANRRSKIWTWFYVAFSILALFLFFGFLQYRALRVDYRKLYAEAFFGSRFDTLANKPLAINIARYLYGLQGDDNKKELFSSYARLFKDPAVQVMLSKKVIKIKGDGLWPNEFDVSDNGAFIVSRIGKTGYSFQLWSQRGDSVDTFQSVRYMYFMQGGDLLFLAKRFPDSTSLYSEQSNSFEIYDCKQKRKLFAMKLDNGFLYGKDSVFPDAWSRGDSHRVRYSLDGKLIIPTRRQGDDESSPGQVLVVSAGKLIGKINGSYTVSNSSDGRWIMTGNPAGISEQSHIEIYNPANLKAPLMRIANSDYGDFTNNNAAIFLQGSEIVLTDLYGKTIFRVPNTIKAARMKVDASGRYIIAETASKGFGSYDLVTGKSYANNDQLEGIDFARKRVLLRKGLRKGEVGSRFIFQDFQGKVQDSFKIDSAILRTVFNSSTGDFLVMDRAYRLWLLNPSLTLKAVYQLTPNDFFGFTYDGKYLYYVQDNVLNVLENKPGMVNPGNIEQMGKWLFEQEERLGFKVTDEVVKKYKLPGRRWLGLGYFGSNGKE